MINRHARRFHSRTAQIRQLSVTVKDCLTHLTQKNLTQTEKDVSVQGWIRSFRKGKNISFLVVNDGSTHESLQAVIRGPQINIEGLSFGTSVRVSGRLLYSIKGTQAVELDTSTVNVIGPASHDYPLQKKYTSAEHLRFNAHLRPRTQFNSSLLRIQSYMLHTLSSFFQTKNAIQVLPPVMTSSDCEGAGETFQISKSEDFFGMKTNLIVSSQLHLEALAMGVGKVWTLVPTFRAERSTTARHLAEFRMLEAELCFTNSLHDVMDITESLIRNLTQGIIQHPDLQFIRSLNAENIEQDVDMQARWDSILGTPWTRIRFSEAVRILETAGASEDFVFSPSMDSGLQAEHEKFLAKYFNGPVFVTNYPAVQKPFYMLPAEDGTVECFDLLVPSMGELCGGSLRDDNLDSLLHKMRIAGMNEGDLTWYTDLRRYGSVPHGGFGLGWERLVGYLCGVNNVREIAAFPRWVNHCVG
ncbi:Putative uncharacterized protein [Taphrina deformans PYCC 5710]|uniref:asparagine--tRNA ligase n=1 Tax=Taphrina deformans (strain PYCC 5710 / ATCC 11124 / CBS 356.35 / IMI 108563 / JCM 9778 / NBRC 8474) TaxID=1097556 RepID=R4XC25_TAPDE|nr:Putative uncharacterized protein [Taphrina deformans PYCC 5710]|eukprot:CCG81931.1 Putative uncharacterized protein [Taphrina deformans PYCC 5710]